MSSYCSEWSGSLSVPIHEGTEAAHRLQKMLLRDETFLE